MKTNTLFYGDNLDILQRYIKDESVDLIYLDPPFNSKATYNVLFAEKNGSNSAAQIKAFDDTWHWDKVAAEAYHEIVECGGQVAKAMIAFRTLLGDNDMLAYLTMMAPRLVELKRVLKSTGSIYLHCDPTAGHYLKVLMDAVFEPRNFQNEVIWHYGLGGSSPKRWARKHDTIFFYSKTNKWHFSPLMIPATSVRMRGQKKKMTDVWDVPTINNMARERLGYPTQKPEALLERIIKASSNEGDLVLDPFCGCGTTVAVAQRLKRRWIGIDVTHLAVTLMKHRLRDAFGDGISFKVIGEPTTLPGARALAKQDRFQFQFWALGLVGARPVSGKKGADKGIDGRLYFHDEPKGKTKQVIISVKSGNIKPVYIRDLEGVVEREKAQIGIFVTLRKPTKPMRSEAASAGFYDSPWGTRHPGIQILTIEELLEGKRIDYPPTRGDATFKKAPKAESERPSTVPMFNEN